MFLKNIKNIKKHVFFIYGLKDDSSDDKVSVSVSGEAPRSSPGLCLWTPLKDFRRPVSLCPFFLQTLATLLQVCNTCIPANFTTRYLSIFSYLSV